MSEDKTKFFLSRLAGRFDLTGYDTSSLVYVNARKPVKIVCPLHGEFKVRPDSLLNDRSRRAVCGECSKFKLRESKVEQSLLQVRPDLAALWHPTKNLPLEPDKISLKSNQRVWWTCNNNSLHEHQSSVNNKTRSEGASCPYCSGRLVNATNCLSALYPDIAAEWHPEKNGPKKPSDVYARTNVGLYWWKCSVSDDHVWQAKVEHRTVRGIGCPFCAGRKVASDNNLLMTHPSVAAEWHPTKNSPASPENFLPTSHKKVWWVCSVNSEHQWQALIYARARNGYGCPYCGGRAPTPQNNLKVVHPEIAAEMHPTLNGDLQPEALLPGSDKKIWWQCSQNSQHEYQSRIVSRVSGRGCPYCSGKLVNHTNSLRTTFPELAMQWHPIKNKDLNPDEVTAGSSKKVWWICPRDSSHEWKATISSRAKGANCPSCRGGTSLPELRIFSELSALFEDVENRAKFGKDEVDIFLPALMVGVEYDGLRFHEEKARADTAKTKRLSRQGISIIRVREFPLSKLQTLDVICDKHALKKSAVDELLLSIQKCVGYTLQQTHRYLQQDSFVAEAQFRKLASYLPDPIPLHNLETNSPELLTEWDYEKNFPLVPSNFTKRSGRKVHWKCRQVGHSWEATISSRVGGTGCPYCKGLKASSEYNLAVKFPTIAEEWDYEKNHPLKPTDVTPFSGKKVFWRCKIHSDTSWKCAIVYRTKFNQKYGGCKLCKN